MTQFQVGPAVPPDWQAAVAKLETAYAVLVANVGQMNARIDALEQRLGDGRVVPKTLRVKDTGIVLEVEAP